MVERVERTRWVGPMVHPRAYGGSGGGSTLSQESGEALGGHRAVRIGSDGLVYYASSDNEATTDGVVGITSKAAELGAKAQITMFGPLTEPTWSWSPGPIFLGVNGILTQTPPTNGVGLILGYALTPTQMIVRIEDEVLL